MVNFSVLNKGGIKGILREYLVIFLNIIILFLSAGTIAWLQGWFYCALVLLHQTISTLILIYRNPLLLNKRAKIVTSKTTNFDIVFVFSYFILILIISIVAGYEKALKVNSVELFFMPGILLFVFSSFLGTWAMMVNPFFNVTNKKQPSINIAHTGPYRYVRHPGYSAWIIGAISYPLILGSVYCCVPVGLLLILFIIRTHKEDNLLKQKAKGYTKYCSQCKYRLIPYIW